MPHVRARREDIAARIQTQMTKEALKLAGKGQQLSKAEQEAGLKGREWNDVMASSANELRRAGGKGAQVRVDPWMEAAGKKITAALDEVDAKGRGHGFISLIEARNASVDGDAGARIGAAFTKLTGKSLALEGAPKPELVAAAEAFIASRGFNLLNGLKDDEPNKFVSDLMEKAMEAMGADSGVGMSARTKLGKELVRVAAGAGYTDGYKEPIALFDREGRELARATIERNEDTFQVTMKNGKGEVIAQSPATAPATPDAAWVASLNTRLEKLRDDGEDMGVDMDKKDLPPALLPIYEFNERNVADGVGLSKIEHEGKTAYIMHDWSCVSSHAVMSEDGAMLLSYTD